ncbi:hypothetical protein Cgig2_013090 [Carnegiea gigantea]|uniref:C2H2-type domain-containing protein n=1 Tax=Carnegiea gigantea TaxID=171969 RepID=A0A9Q1QLN4_9CARY|nr:hypothetical protein Cgig2_013090 [Carnegiea gigantea]
MRAHGIGDESEAIDDDDPASDWEDKSRGGGESIPPSNKRMYALRTNPNRLRSCRVCENCGKEFISWKSFLEHGNGKCTSLDDNESIISSPIGSDGEAEGRRACGWSKRKRSYRTKVGTYCHSSEEEDLANCLMMLSNATVDPYLVGDQPEESCASANRQEEEKRNPISFFNPFLARPPPAPPLDHKAKGGSSINAKACKKVFNSHQALGGHRASHKKVKGCFAARLDHVDQDSFGDEDNTLASDNQEFMRPSKSSCSTLQLQQGRPNSPIAISKRKSKVHECSICHRVFSSGQALGGHKRCHWITSNAPDPLTLARFQELQDQIEQVQEMPMFSHSEQALDLNLPAPKEDMMGIRRDPRNPLSFEVSTEIFLQSWGSVNVEMKHEHHPHHHHEQDEHNENVDDDNEGKRNNNSIYESNMANNVDDGADSKVKLAKLCELKDHVSPSGSSSPWLQVGISSSTTVGADP